ncbi:MAG: 50S ribosomal protein L5 [Mycoplasmataceae bacterium]|jgi:large subunit ribosomal protein L5|nr:50S ribosomal protein L5 [Mycoplasmataceae bacterium]
MAKKHEVNSFKDKYAKLTTKALMEEFKYRSPMQVPHLEKIVINAGIGDATKDAKLIEAAFNEIQNITGQKPVLTKSKKAIASFKLREDQAIGVKVTLRGNNMYNFMEKLIHIALPRVRDFKGISRNGFDGHGNYTLGIKEQIIFIEVNYDDVKRVRGFDVTFVTSAKNDAEALALLTAFGLPFTRKK